MPSPYREFRSYCHSRPREPPSGELRIEYGEPWSQCWADGGASKLAARERRANDFGMLTNAVQIENLVLLIAREIAYDGWASLALRAPADLDDMDRYRALMHQLPRNSIA